MSDPETEINWRALAESIAEDEHRNEATPEELAELEARDRDRRLDFDPIDIDRMPF